MIRFYQTAERAVQETPFGWACYSVQRKGDKVVGLHEGTVGTYEDALIWLEGGKPSKLVKVYTDEQKREWMKRNE